MAELGLEALLVTRGEHGMTLLRPGQEELHLPARAREVFDVTGAGDTVIAVLAAVLAAGADLARAAALANIAAGIVVAQTGYRGGQRTGVAAGHPAGPGLRARGTEPGAVAGSRGGRPQPGGAGGVHQRLL